MTTIDDLITEQSETDLTTSMYTDLVDVEGVDVTAWFVGAPTRSIIATVAKALSAFSALQVLIARSGFLDLATGNWLTLVAKFVYNVDRNLGTFASGEVTVNNTSGAVYSGGAESLIFKNTATGKTYKNTAAYFIPALTNNITIPIQALEEGADSTSVAGAIDSLETVLTGVTASNAASVVGVDPELDEPLRVRCVEKTGTASPNGPADAYNFFAKAATRTDGSLVGVTRVLANPAGNGLIDVYVATASGGVNGVATDDTTDLGAVQKTITENVEPISIVATVQSAAVTPINVTYELWVVNGIGLSNIEIEAAITTSLTDFMSTQPIGGQPLSDGGNGKVWISAIRNAINEALPDDTLVNLSVTAPIVDVDLLVNQAAVLGTLTTTAINRVQDVG